MKIAFPEFGVSLILISQQIKRVKWADVRRSVECVICGPGEERGESIRVWNPFWRARALTFDKPGTLSPADSHKGLITHKLSDLRRSRNVNMKYENEDGCNKSDVRDSVGSLVEASIMPVCDGGVFVSHPKPVFRFSSQNYSKYTPYGYELLYPPTLLNGGLSLLLSFPLSS